MGQKDIKRQTYRGRGRESKRKRKIKREIKRKSEKLREFQIQMHHI